VAVLVTLLSGATRAGGPAAGVAPLALAGAEVRSRA
jgi:hypothetical protein